MQEEMKSSGEDKTIKVCFVAPKAYPLFRPEVKGVFGGAEVDLYLLSTELAKDKNFEVSFITADYGQEKVRNINGVSVIKSFSFKENSLIGAIKIWRAMRLAGAQIYFQETASWGTFLVALFCKLYKKIFIFRFSHQHEWDGTFSKHHFLAGKAFCWALHNADFVTAPNEFDKVKFKERTGIFVTVIPYAHRSCALSEVNKDSILWVGRSTGFKRPYLFLDLAEKFPAERFVMICQRATGDAGYEELLEKTRKATNLQFIERVPFHDIMSYFQRAKVFVNTSESEGFPNTFIQAGLCGVPVLSLKVNPDGFLEKYKCGVCCNDNWEELVNSLKCILEGDRYVELGRNAREYFEESHSIIKVIEQYKTIFNRLTKEKDAAAIGKT